MHMYLPNICTAKLCTGDQLRFNATFGGSGSLSMQVNRGPTIQLSGRLFAVHMLHTRLHSFNFFYTYLCTCCYSV